MRRRPVLLPVSAFAAGLVLAITGCATGGSRSTQAEQAMYAAVSKPAATAAVPPCRAKWAGRPGPGCAAGCPAAAGSRCPRRAAPARAARGRPRPLKPSVLNAVVPGWDSPGAVTLADPGPPAPRPLMSLSCAAAHLPAGTNALTGLNTLAEQEFTAINSSNAQLGQTSVDGHPAVLVYNQMSVGTANVTALQYAIAAPGGRTCYVTLATQQQVPYMPVFSRLRPAIQVLGT